ncbi:ALB3.2 [Symbiodinium natans]|uniref:ALB3.2 protein n=1 Tax=Symbiodinium natans TaxID=878477 RepID=A0A812TUH7_9DINO|nr:ALB3.2 [Symbiodinium natans]
MARRARRRGESLVLCLALCVACREGAVPKASGFCAGLQPPCHRRAGSVVTRRVDPDTAQSLSSLDFDTLKDVTTAVAQSPVLDPNVKYLYGADGEVLIDLASKKPLEDNWFNAACGFQAQMIKNLDQGLRFIGVPQAFGWAVLSYTCLVKVLLYPLEKTTARNIALNKMLAPKMAEMKETIKDKEVLSKRTVKIYERFNMNPLAGCVPVLLQIPIIWTLIFGVRRLASEHYEPFSEPWLWVPSLGEPNPGFEFSLDWLLSFQAGEPVIGWNIWLRQMILPVVLVGINAFPLLRQQQKGEEVGVTSYLPLLLTLWITTEFPQAICLYYLAFYGVKAVEDEYAKREICEEFPQFAIFEETGKFPEGNFDDVLFPSLHRAAKNGLITEIVERAEEGADINATDEQGLTPVAYAAGLGNVPAVAALCALGADVRCRDLQQNSLFHLAAAYDHVGVISYLDRFTEDDPEFSDNVWINWKNDLGYTVLDIAKQDSEVHSYLSSRLQPVAAPPMARSLD